MAVSRDRDDLNPSLTATEHLSDVIDSGEGHEDIVILDEKLQARVAEHAETAEQREEEALTIIPEIGSDVRAREARRSSHIVEVVSERERVRLLIFTKNVAVRQLGSLAQKRLLELSSLFAEMHVVILTEAFEETAATVRLADNIWLYSTESTSWWKMGFDAYRIAREQLVFGGGFRADIVMAEDPFESGVAARFIADKYDRPLQIHVLEDIYESEFKERDPRNVWRLYLAQYVFKHAQSVRTGSEYLKSEIIREYPALAEHVEALPLYYNLETWRDMIPTMSLKERYPQFKFIILHVTNMSARSHTVEVVNGVSPILRMYPTIGLVIVGNGPYRPAIEKQVIALGLHGQVVFEPTPDEVISHMKSANVLVHLSDDPEEDATVLEAAAVKLPMIASRTNIAGTLFTDSESAFLCDGADPACVSYRLKVFLNDNPSRTRFAMNAQGVVFERIEQDYSAYLDAYRNSIERCFN